MGVQSCNGCRSWEEDIYWSHFQFLHFVQFLRTGYDQHLALPKTFSDNLKKKPPANVTLKGPSGVAWNVGIITSGDTLYFARGWEQFVKDQCLKENDFLVFKYNGESQFDVLVFDGGSLCEKASSYFVRKCGHTEAEDVGGSLNKKRDNAEDPMKEGHIPLKAGVQCASPGKSVHANGTKEPINVPFETPTPSEEAFNADVESAGAEQITSDGVPLSAVPKETVNGKRIRKLASVVKHVQTKRRGRGRPAKVSTVIERALDWVSGLDAEPVSAVRSAAQEAFISNRRPVTDDEIKNALALAQAGRTDDSLVVVMRPSHVYKRFFVSMPNKWIGEHIPPMSQDVILRMDKGEWVARYSYHNIRHTGGLTGGWKHFVLDNNLEEYDVCVFKPAGQMNDNLVLDMSIFRVVEEIVPLSVMSPTGKRGRKPAAQNAILTET
ncbi:B3 domain-containing protein REM16 [Vigna umbellata]|uniref:B3 domain-containing protein REM16 n=1 Tax=Vigna umbellata TaxID=87088 RepID=UPI001F5EB557|nr:B3 domain-containing protein REM16 [Vigna umbellata]